MPRARMQGSCRLRYTNQLARARMLTLAGMADGKECVSFRLTSQLDGLAAPTSMRSTETADYLTAPPVMPLMKRSKKRL
jgi:hypothetical protein